VRVAATRRSNEQAGTPDELEKLSRRLAAETAERRRLEEALRSLPHQILTAQDVERRRIAAELHDGVNQILASIKFRLMHAEAKLGDQPIADNVTEARKLVERAVAEVRRISHHLRPSELDDFGLIAAVEALVQEFEKRTKIKVEFKRGPLPKRFLNEVELAIYRILQEALANVEQHSSARNVAISLGADVGYVTLNIRDDGRGFDPEKARPTARGRGLGIINMRERTQAHGGVFSVNSRAGRGAEISVHVKIQS